jgi:hypothetical protein
MDGFHNDQRFIAMDAKKKAQKPRRRICVSVHRNRIDREKVIINREAFGPWR